MKKLKVFFLLGFLFTTSTLALAQTYPQPYSRSSAQLSGRYPHIIKVNFLSPFVLTANVAYEQFLSPKISVQLGAFYNGISLEEADFFFLSIPAARYRSFAFTPEFRFYTGSETRPKLNGFYIAPFIRYQNTDIRITPQQQDDQAETRTFEGNLNTFRIGAVAGYKFIIGERISLEAFAGPSLRVTKWLNANIETYSAEDFLPFGLGLRSGMTIGFVF